MPDGSEKPEKIDPSSPFFVSQTDKPGNFMTTARLTLANFDDWSYSVRTALNARRKYGFLNGTYTEPIPPCTADDWETIHSLLVSWLMNVITPEVKSLLPNYENAKLLWDDLHNRFRVIDGSRIQQLQSSLRDCRQLESMSVAVYYGKLCQLWDELDKYVPIISCRCNKCECNVGKQHVEQRESERLHQFLMGLLPALYGTLRSVLLSQTPLPTLQRAFNLISQEERVRIGDAVPEPAPAVSNFAIRTDARPAQPRLSALLPRTE
ncbi:uncharacterized protein LOC141630906 [Silene latifolia]|uniref:uncharacterized protein LOC141630906 n=1 Tax=Silene latifolia TaxID=37657 RepID=UPI003D776C69